MPRSPHAYQIWRGGAPPRKVQRWLHVIGFDASKMPVPGSSMTLLQQAAARHVHPRSKRHVPRDIVLADNDRTSDPFAALQKGLT